jgi:hypothetical protein
MTEIITLPSTTPDGRAIVSDNDFEVRAVVPPAEPIVLSGSAGGFSENKITAPLADWAAAPASAVKPNKTVQVTKTMSRRGRLPNMPVESAHLPPPITPCHSPEVPSSSSSTRAV